MPLQFYSAKRASLHKYMKHIHNYTQYFIQFKSEKKGHLIYYWTIFWTQLQVSLQIYHPGARATQLSPEETCYKAYILGKLKFSHCICIKLAVQVRFLPFFFHSVMPLSNSQESLVYQDKLSTTDTSSFLSVL